MNNKHINKLLFLFLILISFASCKKEQGISHQSIGNQFLDISGNIARVYISAGAQQSNFGGFINSYDGSLYLNSEVNNNFHNIDLYYRFSEKEGNELYTTDAKGFTYTRELELMGYSWPYHNRGELYILKNPSATQIKAFEAVKNNEELKKVYQDLLADINAQAGSVQTGQKRITQVAANSIVLFSSTTKNTKSVLLVNSIATSIQGRLSFSIKTDISNRNIISKQPTSFLNNGKPADILELSVEEGRTDENFIDLLNRKIYKATDLPNGSMENINLVHVFNNTSNPNRHSFYTPTSGFSGTNYVPAFWDWMGQQPNRKNTYLIRLDVNGTATIQDRYNSKTFDDVAHNNESLVEYHNYIAYQTSFASHITTSEVGMVYRVYDTNTGAVGLIKLLELDLANKKAKIAVKYAIPE